MAARVRRRTGATRAESTAYSSPVCYAHEFDSPAAQAGARGFDIKRIYEPAASTDGYRVLVDRLWPRGISKQRAALDDWLPEIVPSTVLRQWLHHDPKRWRVFIARYRTELRAQGPLLQSLRQRAREQRVTLLYGARDPNRNHAIVLREALRRARRSPQSRR